jgi:hypothetical protein
MNGWQMADIREPYPVKPVWPTRPGKSIGEKRTPATDKEQEKEKRKKQQPSDNSRPHIDDYA